MSQTFNTPTRRIPHPFAADYSPPRPRTRPSFPFTDVSNTAHSRIPSPPPPPCSAIPPVPSLDLDPAITKRTKSPRRTKTTRAPTARTSTLRVPIPAPIPLSSPPPPVYQPVVQPSHSQSTSDLLRPDSRIQRDRKKPTKISPWDLKHVRASSPASKGLWTLFEVDEDWVRITDELQRRPVSYAYLAPFIMTSPSTPFRNTPSPDKRFLSARPSSEVLAPSPPVGALSSRVEHGEDREVMEVLTDTESTANHLVTPIMEEEDPFALDGAWNDSPVRSFTFGTSPADSTADPGARRPAPLTLASSNKIRPSSYSSIVFAEDDVISPPISPSPVRRRLASPKLLSPIAIASPGVRQARRRSASGPPDVTPPRAKRASHDRPESPSTSLDLESALEDFLACCGEHFSDLEAGMSSDSDSDGLLDADLFYRRPPSSVYASSENGSRAEEGGSVASAFPLPPTRECTPRRPHPAASQTLGLAIDMGSPALFSPEPATPVTPTPAHRRGLLPSLPIIPTRTSSRNGQSARPRIKLQSDHSFLQSLSRGDEPFAMSPVSDATSSPLSPASQVDSISSFSSSGSALSGESLPKRDAIPASWKLFAATNRI